MVFVGFLHLKLWDDQGGEVDVELEKMNPENVMVGEPKREVLLRIEWQQLEPFLVAQRPARVVTVVEVQVLEDGMVDVW